MPAPIPISLIGLAAFGVGPVFGLPGGTATVSGAGVTCVAGKVLHVRFRVCRADHEGLFSALLLTERLLEFQGALEAIVGHDFQRLQDDFARSGVIWPG